MKNLYLDPEISIIKFTLSDVLAPSEEIEVPDIYSVGNSGATDDLDDDSYWTP